MSLYGMKLSTETFYGKFSSRRPKSRVIKNVEHSSEPLQAVPLDFHSTLWGPSVVWKLFKRMQPALDYASLHTKDAMVFSFEEKSLDCNGRRSFLVTHPEHMWLIHKSRPLAERCSYEIIQAGKPCKLYFDLEFSKVLNPQKNGVLMTKTFIKCVIAVLQETYDLICDENTEVLWLDSSTEKKFSCHLIFNMKQAAFKDNTHAGYFVFLLLDCINAQVEKGITKSSSWPSVEQMQEMLVLYKNNLTSIFCDKGVYTRNRNFRLYLSSKLEKKVPLVLFSTSVSAWDGTNYHINEQCLFLDSLITYFRIEDGERRLLEHDLVNLVRRCNSGSHVTSKFLGVEGQESSLFPEIDDYILSIVKDESKIGFIRKWTYISSKSLLIFDIGNYRYCHNINRHHKSNNIMFVVELKAGVFYQKCYDPVCRSENFRSEVLELPEQVLNAIKIEDDFFEDECEENFFEPSSPASQSSIMNITKEEEEEMVSALELVESRT